MSERASEYAVCRYVDVAHRLRSRLIVCCGSAAASEFALGENENMPRNALATSPRATTVRSVSRQAELLDIWMHRLLTHHTGCLTFAKMSRRGLSITKNRTHCTC